MLYYKSSIFFLYGMILFIFLCFALISFILVWLFFAFYEYKIHRYELYLARLFSKRTDTLPWLFEVSKWILSKHREIFSTLIDLRKEEFHLRSLHYDLHHIINLEQKIHHEINFIFRVSNKHQSLIKKKQFLYLREIILDQSDSIAKAIRQYNHIIERHNLYITYKNRSILWLFLPFFEKKSI